MSFNYLTWTDSELLEEADERELNTVESEMLNSMMTAAGLDKLTHTTMRPLTPRQRAWLERLLHSTHPARD